MLSDVICGLAQGCSVSREFAVAQTGQARAQDVLAGAASPLWRGSCQRCSTTTRCSLQLANSVHTVPIPHQYSPRSSSARNWWLALRVIMESRIRNLRISRNLYAHGARIEGGSRKRKKETQILKRRAKTEQLLASAPISEYLFSIS